jgi:hypothetical protein
MTTIAATMNASDAKTTWRAGSIGPASLTHGSAASIALGANAVSAGKVRLWFADRACIPKFTFKSVY